MHEYTPANLPGLPAGWEIRLFEGHNYADLSLWRVMAFLHPYRYDGEEEYALTYSSSRWSDAELPLDYTEDDLAEALQELVWKANQLADRCDESAVKYIPELYPPAVERTT